MARPAWILQCGMSMFMVMLGGEGEDWLSASWHWTASTAWPGVVYTQCSTQPGRISYCTWNKEQSATSLVHHSEEQQTWTHSWKISCKIIVGVVTLLNHSLVNTPNCLWEFESPVDLCESDDKGNSFLCLTLCCPETVNHDSGAEPWVLAEPVPGKQPYHIVWY